MKKKGFPLYSLRDVILFVVFGKPMFLPIEVSLRAVRKELST